MNIKTYMRFIGTIFLLLGICGFIPALVAPPLVDDPLMHVASSYGRLFGLFPVNSIFNVVNIVLGLWGLTARNDTLSARRFCKFVGVFEGVLTLFGLVPGFNILFGLMPLFSHDIWLNAIIAGVTSYYGFSAKYSSGLPIHRTDEIIAPTSDERVIDEERRRAG